MQVLYDFQFVNTVLACGVCIDPFNCTALCRCIIVVALLFFEVFVA